MLIDALDQHAGNTGVQHRQKKVWGQQGDSQRKFSIVTENSLSRIVSSRQFIFTGEIPATCPMPAGIGCSAKH